MIKYDDILQAAADHHGGSMATLAKAANGHAVEDVRDVPDDRWLATMARCVFNAGFNWKVIDAKWPGFEAAFEGFDPTKLTFFAEDMLDRLLSDERIVRNGQKIKATLQNAKFVAGVSAEQGGFGHFLANWPAEDQLGLMTYLGKNGARLGGATAQYTLRFGGWDGWIASPDMCRALHREGVLDEAKATTKGALLKVQAAVNTLHDQSDQPRAVLSRLLALSVG